MTWKLNPELLDKSKEIEKGIGSLQIQLTNLVNQCGAGKKMGASVLGNLLNVVQQLQNALEKVLKEQAEFDGFLNEQHRVLDETENEIQNIIDMFGISLSVDDTNKDNGEFNECPKSPDL